MPAWLPEGNQVLPSQDEMRTWAVICQIIYDSVGEKASPFPEGCAPKPGDDQARLEMKVNAMLQ